MSAGVVTTRVRWGRVMPAAAIAAVAIGVCGMLGWWQWTRAHDQAVVVQQEPPVPIAEVLAPATEPGAAVGRQVTVRGSWLASDAALVPGREVDGVPAVFLVRAFEVDADATGTGAPATLAVLVGWAPADAVTVDTAPPGTADVAGYLRASEAGAPGADGGRPDVPGAFWTGAVATAALAQEWPAPLYSTTLVSDTGETGWEPLPPREPPTRLDFRSLAYAFEWWIFGAFAAFLAARYIRDNGFDRPAQEETADD